MSTCDNDCINVTRTSKIRLAVALLVKKAYATIGVYYVSVGIIKDRDVIVRVNTWNRMTSYAAFLSVQT